MERFCIPTNPHGVGVSVREKPAHKSEIRHRELRATDICGHAVESGVKPTFPSGKKKKEKTKEAKRTRPIIVGSGWYERRAAIANCLISFS